MSFEMTASVAAIYQVLTPSDIQDEISSCTFKTQSILEVNSRVNSSHSLALLLKFKWDIDALKESFHASQDLSECLIGNNASLKVFSEAPIHPECQLCLAVEDVEGFACRHMACGLCWKAYLKVKIESGNLPIECFGCSLLICNDKLEAFLRKSELLTAYRELTVNSYVENTSYLTWCSKKCGNAVRRSNSDNVSCSCGARFCFQCKLDPHTPASCDHMKLWEKACEALEKFADTKSWEWIQDNTQACPQCLAPIQKNGGCNYINCGNCKHRFCWNCRGTRRNEGDGHTCKYPKAIIVRPNLQKFAPYLLSFNYHKEKNDDSSSTSECRQTLMYSFVYAYCQVPEKITRDFIQLQKKLRDVLDLEQSKKNLEKCEQLRKSILHYCSSNPRGKGVEKTKTDERCYITFGIFFVLFLCLILAIIGLTVLTVSLFV